MDTMTTNEMLASALAGIRMLLSENEIGKADDCLCQLMLALDTTGTVDEALVAYEAD